MTTRKSAFNKLFLITLACLLPVAAQAQISWRATQGFNQSGICKLVNSSIRATVFPGYLDVEEEAEILATGTVNAGTQSNSLEIHGNFAMVPGATVVGMILWNGDIPLKARLKGKLQATEEYEKVVDRDTKDPVPVPRDPAIIEYIGNNQYRIQIFPVTSGKSRRLRLRYQIPCQISASGMMLRMHTVFPPSLDATGTKVNLKLVPGLDQTKGYTLYINGKARTASIPGNFILALKDDVYLTQSPVLPSLTTMTSFSSGAYQGHYVGVYVQVPAKIVNYPSLNAKPDFAVVAVLKSGTDSYSLDVACTNTNGFRCDPVEFHGKASTAWNPEIEWHLYNKEGRELAVHKESPELFSNPSDSSLVALWAGSALPFAEVRERYLGVKYGFVDVTVSLLALEQDSLPRNTWAAYASQGVPRLTQLEIFPPDTNDVFIPVQKPGEDRATGLLGRLKRSNLSGAFSGLMAAQMIGGAFRALNLEKNATTVLPARFRVSLLGLDGREIASWNVESGSAQAFTLPLPALRSGFYFVKVSGKGFNWSQKILMR